MRLDDGFTQGDRRVPGPTKGERQRRALLDGLARLLASRPISDLTVAEIAAEAAVGRSAFYVYFDSKYAALAVITSEAWTELAEQTDTFTRRENENPKEFLERTGLLALDVWRKYSAVLVASRQAITADEQIASMWKTWNSRLVEIITTQLRNDAETGLATPATADIPRLVTDLHDMMQQAFYLDRLHGNDEVATKRMFDSIIAIWLAAGWGYGAGAP